jgi:hypothetical protein
LIAELRTVTAVGQITALITRDIAGGISLEHADALAGLLKELHAAGADDQVAALADRVATSTAFTTPWEAETLLQALHSVGAGPQAGLYAERLPAEGHYAIFLQHDPHPERLRFGREPDGKPAPPWNWDDIAAAHDA